MNHFIIVFLSMIITLILTQQLIKDTQNSKDVILNFEDNKIKCKCDIKDSNPQIKENFSNYDKEIIIEKPKINENLITSINNLEKSKISNITAENYYESKYIYPLKPIEISSYEVFPFNEYKYINLGDDIVNL